MRLRSIFLVTLWFAAFGIPGTVCGQEYVPQPLETPVGLRVALRFRATTTA